MNDPVGPPVDILYELGQLGRAPATDVNYLQNTAQPLRSTSLKTLRSRHTYSPPAGHGGVESCDRGQLTTVPQVSARS